MEKPKGTPVTLLSQIQKLDIGFIAFSALLLLILTIAAMVAIVIFYALMRSPEEKFELYQSFYADCREADIPESDCREAALEYSGLGED